MYFPSNDDEGVKVRRNKSKTPDVTHASVRTRAPEYLRYFLEFDRVNIGFRVVFCFLDVSVSLSLVSRRIENSPFVVDVWLLARTAGAIMRFLAPSPLRFIVLFISESDRIGMDSVRFGGLFHF